MAKTEKSTGIEEPALSGGSEEIATLAYRFWEERGCPLGSDHEDWYRAEAELSKPSVLVGASGRAQPL
jgi:hypothetical protein